VVLLLTKNNRWSGDAEVSTLRVAAERNDAHSPADPSTSTEVLRRITRNVGWLILSDGFRLASMVANLLIARFLGASNFGVVALARETARYAALPSDLGIATYGQAAAAKCPEDKLAELADEIVPARGLIGLSIYALLAVLCLLKFHDRTARIVFLSSGVFVISETLRVDWMFRGRERFDLIVVARAVEALSFLAIVLMVGSRPHAVIFDSIGWSASELLMAGVWLVLLPRTIGRAVRLRIDLRGWLSHATEAVYVPIAVGLVWSGWLILIWLVAWTGSRREVGLLAAPYGLTMSCVNMGIMLVMGFFPTSATLARDSPLFTNVRQTLTSAMLILSVPIAIVGTAIAEPLVRFLFGPAYLESVTLLLLLIWLIPLRLMRAAYGYTLVSSGFQKVFPLGPAAGLLVTTVVGIPLTLHYHAFGAAAVALVAELAGTATTIVASRICYGDSSLPDAGWFVKFAILNLALSFGGMVLAERVGWILFLILAAALYPFGLVAFELIDIRGTATALFDRTQIVTSA
jgi:O-antigen/teichoic acid export membrane protein